jgi:formyl-CoA transferase
MTAGALAGLRVLDLASLYAAPLIASLLADHGADVVKVEPPGGDGYRATPLWPLVARGKRSVVLDLTDPAGRAALHGLVAAADVVVVNEPTGRLARRGLDPAGLLAVNPGLVVAHVSGYGSDGPYADRPGNGTISEAFAGLTHMTGAPDGPPVLPSVPLGDVVMAFAGAFGVLAACLDVRAGGGRGRVVDVNPVEAMLHVVGPTLTSATAGADRAGPPGTAAGASPPPGRLGSRMDGAAMRGVFATADGQWVAVSVSTARQLSGLTALVGAPAGMAGAELEEAVRGWFAGRSRVDALDRLAAARLPVTAVNTAHDVATDPHVLHRRALRRLRTGDGGTVLVPAATPRTDAAARASRQPVEAAEPEVLPDVGQHTAQVLAEWPVAGRHPPDAAGRDR